jgi:hypothetical protein
MSGLTLYRGADPWEGQYGLRERVVLEVIAKWALEHFPKRWVMVFFAIVALAALQPLLAYRAALTARWDLQAFRDHEALRKEQISRDIELVADEGADN